MYPYEKVPSGHIDVEIVKLPNGAQIMRTNLTVFRENKGVLVGDILSLTSVDMLDFKLFVYFVVG